MRPTRSLSACFTTGTPLSNRRTPASNSTESSSLIRSTKRPRSRCLLRTGTLSPWASDLNFAKWAPCKAATSTSLSRSWLSPSTTSTKRRSPHWWKFEAEKFTKLIDNLILWPRFLIKKGPLFQSNIFLFWLILRLCQITENNLNFPWFFLNDLVK